MTYGCGSTECTLCYPFIYRCEGCGEDYLDIIRNGEPLPVCENCGWNGKQFEDIPYTPTQDARQ